MAAPNSSSGLRLLKASLPTEMPAPQGTPAGLAHSVQPVLEVVAPVASEGAGFSPNFVPLALWMGAVMTAFLFHFGRLPAQLMAAPRAATVAGRLVVPALVAAGQSLVMLAMLVGVLHVPVPRVLPFAATLLVASLVFLCLIFALVHLFGDVGKMAAVLLLVVQMSAAGALLPTELTPHLFQAIHQWLPLTWVIHAFRASLFGAYDGALASAWVTMLTTGAAALALAVVFGRWRPQCRPRRTVQRWRWIDSPTVATLEPHHRWRGDLSFADLSRLWRALPATAQSILTPAMRRYLRRSLCATLRSRRGESVSCWSGRQKSIASVMAGHEPDVQSVPSTGQSPLSWRASPETEGSSAVLLSTATPTPNCIASRPLGLVECTVGTHHRLPCFGVRSS